MSDRPRVLVVGAGVIGAAVARQLAHRQCQVVLLGRELSPAAPTASWASAGGLKFQRVEAAAAALTRRAALAWPRLGEELGQDIGLRLWGSLELASCAADLPQLRRQAASDAGRGAAVVLVGREDFAALGAELAPEVTAGSFNPSGGQASPRATTRALIEDAGHLGAELLPGTATQLEISSGRVLGARVGRDLIAADQVVLAAGFWSRQLGRSAGLELPLRPAGAHMLCSEPLPGRRLLPTLSAVGRVLSIKQLPSGELLVGGGWRAPVEADGSTCSPDPQAVERNLRNAHLVTPWSAQVPLPTTWCGIDGETPDGLPLLGPWPGLEGLYLAAGFSLGGFQISPAVGELVAQELVSGEAEAALAELRPARFGDLGEAELRSFQESQRGLAAR